ncbi:MAG: TIGR03032 family protein [Alphaproteobacteria bacterium]
MTDTAESERKLEINVSRHFTTWMAENGVSLAFTTYQAGKLFFLGRREDGRMTIFERTFNRCMGLAAAGETLWMSSLYQVWRFENALEPGQLHNDHDRLYVPQVGYTTGDIDTHDMGIRTDGSIVFANTKFSCLATTDATRSFRPVWVPDFITRLAPEDRCHLNGLAMRDGAPAYVSAVSTSDVADGWRDKRTDGGVIIDVTNNEIVADGLSMPHSPRWHNDKLWMLNAGTGELGFINSDSGSFEPIAFCPGFLRGLAFAGKFAIVGLSLPREAGTFQGLPLDDKLGKAGAEARCGLLVIDTETGDTLHWLRIEGIVEELYDVVSLPGVVRPMAIGFQSDEINRIVTIGDDG